VVGLVDGTSGLSSAEYEYGPFGEPLRVTGVMGELNPMQFSTKYRDRESGFCYYGYRSYNPNTGRWLNRDPITELGFLLQQTGRQLFQGSKSDSPPVGVEDDDPDINQLLVGPGGLNAYGFNGNNAIIFVDYLGLAPFCVCVRAAGDHAWIVVTDLATGEVHSYGRYLLYFGKPRANHSGVHKDMASDRTRKYDAQRCVTVQSFTPTVDNGYDTLNNNCVTYAASEWKRASGESFSIRNTGWGHPDYDDPEKLVNAINKANAGKKKSEDCCGKAPK
jgi:RHS repeat-associated protein